MGHFTSIEMFVLKMRRSYDRLIFMIEIAVSKKYGLYIEAEPAMLAASGWQNQQNQLLYWFNLLVTRFSIETNSFPYSVQDFYPSLPQQQFCCQHLLKGIMCFRCDAAIRKWCGTDGVRSRPLYLVSNLFSEVCYTYGKSQGNLAMISTDFLACFLFGWRLCNRHPKYKCEIYAKRHEFCITFP